MSTIIVGERFNYHKDWRPSRPETELDFTFLCRLGCMRRGAGRKKLEDLGFRWDRGLNLLMPSKTPGEWDAGRAREVATAILPDLLNADHVLLLGRRVARAFGIVDWKPFRWHRWDGQWWWRHTQPQRFVTLPHPSGLCRIWNGPEAIDEAREIARLTA